MQNLTRRLILFVEYLRKRPRLVRLVYLSPFVRLFFGCWAKKTPKHRRKSVFTKLLVVSSSLPNATRSGDLQGCQQLGRNET